MLKRFSSKYLSWAILLVLAVSIKIFSLNADWVQKYYTTYLYPKISIVLRFLFGWLPFSVGDIIYAAAIGIIIFKILRGIKYIKKEKITGCLIVAILRKTVFVLLLVYVIFYGFWGLNYSGKGIASQLNLQEIEYTTNDLDTLVAALHQKLNANAALLTPYIRDSINTKKKLFSNAVLLYKIAATKYPFLKYNRFSVKPSLYSYLGNYIGFQGYYNPFTGEAQVNTTIPVSLTPFVTAHEMAHQIGYAKESEANFLGFLSCKMHPSLNFKYSGYFNMYYYAIKELRATDSIKAQAYDSSLHVQVKKDMEEYKDFYKKYRNPVAPYIDMLYSYFLQANNQPKGKRSYDEVVTWLIAYYKRFGINEL